jgi:HEAT repeat protein
MTTAACPGCRSEVHPLLGDAPLVRDGRVVMCCSDACREMVRDGLVADGPASPETVESGAPEPDDFLGELVELEGVEPDPEPLPVSEPVGMTPTEDTPRVSERPLEAPAPAESPQRRVVLATLVGGGALLLVFAGYLLFDHAYGGGASRASLSTTVGNLRPVTTPEPPRTPSTAPAVVSTPEPTPQRPSLMTLKKQSWRILEGFLASRTGRFWRTAARVLAEQGHSGALAALRKALASGKWANRQRAAEALAKLGHAEGVEVLKKDLAARRRPVKWASAFALARCGDAAGLRVIKQLANYRQHRMTAYEALVRLGDEKGMTYLRDVWKQSQAPYDRLRAAVALGMRGDGRGLSMLKGRMKKPGMHMGVALALQKLGAPEARPALVRALDHTALREEAARALRSYGDVTLVSKMAPELRSNSEDARLTAAAAIVILTAQARAEAR